MNSKVNISLLIVMVLLSCTVTFALTVSFFKPAEKATVVSSTAPTNKPKFCDFDVKRLRSKNLVHPIVLVDSDCPSTSLEALNKTLATTIQQYIDEGKATRISCYVKLMETNEWTHVNGNDLFNPGSMMKVAIMLNVLQAAEKNPEFLQQQLVVKEIMPVPGRKTGNPLVVGKAYSIRQLLDYMIIDSDNDAAALLAGKVDKPNFDAMFEQMGMTAPRMGESDYQISANEFARILRILYNGSLLSLENSDYALRLLTNSAYLEGLVKYLPPNIQVAHKFGERKVQADTEQFHESGVIYLDKQAYVICIMTEGHDPHLLPEIVARLSATVYNSMLDHIAANKSV